MTQVNKFYLASFLKNQTYFAPIMVLFFQDLGLNYSQIFWVFTIGSIFLFLIEIPTGIFADLYGKRRSLVLSKFFIFLSYILFGLSGNFFALLIANLILELGNSFRSGTETAFVYNYLYENKEKSPSYNKVKSGQKFYARISESLGAAIGGFLAYKYGFNFVFFVAAIPAFINFVQTLTWERISEIDTKEQGINLKTSYRFATLAFQKVVQTKALRNLVLNIAIFSAALAALNKFIQPYMDNLGIQLQYFGLIYSGFLIFTAILLKYSYLLEEKLGNIKLMNILSWLAFVPLLILGLGFNSIIGVALFFIIIMIENIRSPIANTIFHQNVEFDNRATMGSILELFKSLFQLILLPLIGYTADIISLKTAILIISLVVLFNGSLFWVSTKSLHDQESRI